MLHNEESLEPHYLSQIDQRLVDDYQKILGKFVEIADTQSTLDEIRVYQQIRQAQASGEIETITHDAESLIKDAEKFGHPDISPTNESPEENSGVSTLRIKYTLLIYQKEASVLLGDYAGLIKIMEGNRYHTSNTNQHEQKLNLINKRIALVQTIEDITALQRELASREAQSGVPPR